MAGILASLKTALDPTTGNSALDQYGAFAVALAIAVAILGYLFGFIPADRFTGLLTLLGGTAGGVYIHHMGQVPPPAGDVGPAGEVASVVGKV